MLFIVNDVPLQCINQAAVEYYVPASLIISIIKTENGKRGSAVKNTNGTYDLGPMQINSSWIPKLKKYGYSAEDIQFDPCKNVEVGAWILSNGIAAETRFDKGVGDYNSHTDRYNKIYRQKVLAKYQHINKLIMSTSI